MEQYPRMGMLGQGNIPDAISGETILGSYAQNLTPVYDNFDKFFGFIPGSVGETSTFLILLGAAFLIFTKIGSWRIIVIYILRSCSNGIHF